jgi:hypothetical protein
MFVLGDLTETAGCGRARPTGRSEARHRRTPTCSIGARISPKASSRVVRERRRLPPLPPGEARIEQGLRPPRSRSSSSSPPARAPPQADPPPSPIPPPILRSRCSIRARSRRGSIGRVGADGADRRSAAARANPRRAPGHREDRVKLLDPTPHEPMRTVAPGSRHRLPCSSASPAGIGLDARASGCARVIIGSTPRPDQLRSRRGRAQPAPNALSSPSPGTDWSHLGRSTDPRSAPQWLAVSS